MLTFNRYPCGPSMFYTLASNSSKLFFPLTGPLRTDGIISVRPDLEVSNSTGDTKVVAAMRTSSDGITWSSLIEILATASPPTPSVVVIDNDSVRDTTFRDISADIEGELLVQFGGAVSNDSGATRELGMLSGRFDTRG